MKRVPAKSTGSKSQPPKKAPSGRTVDIKDEVRSVLTWLERHGTKRNRDGMSRYAIPSDKAFGVSMSSMQGLAKRFGRNHELAEALWKTGWYEARMLASLVDEPARVTSEQMDRWCREFGNWAICDTVCFKLFDQSPHAFRKVKQWSSLRDEFGKRGAFALLASLALHDKNSEDERFLQCLPLIERAAEDERNFVKKGVSWALRGIGHRNPELRGCAIELAKRLAASSTPSARWIGKDALRDLTRPVKPKPITRSRPAAGGPS
jgi:3-methyladenine DNA glycosylase AlkD